MKINFVIEKIFVYLSIINNKQINIMENTITLENKLNSFDTFKIVIALNEMNNGDKNKDILIEQGSIEMFNDTDGCFSVFFTNYNGDCEYLVTVNENSMTGDLSRVLDAINSQLELDLYILELKK